MNLPSYVHPNGNVVESCTFLLPGVVFFFCTLYDIHNMCVKSHTHKHTNPNRKSQNPHILIILCGYKTAAAAPTNKNTHTDTRARAMTHAAHSSPWKT